jgi:hypothetical protein
MLPNAWIGVLEVRDRLVWPHRVMAAGGGDGEERSERERERDA